MWIRLLKPVDTHKAGDFLDVEEKTARSYIDAGLAEDGGNGPDHHLLRSAMAEFQTQMGALVRGVAESIQAATRDLPRPVVVVPGESETEKRHPRSIGGFVRNVVDALGNPDAEARQTAHNRLTAPWSEGGYGSSRAMGEGSGAGGGYTTAKTYETELLRVAGETGILAPDAKVVPLSNREHEWPSLDQFQVPTAGQSAFYAGVKVYRKGENTQRTASQPSLTKVRLVAQDMTAYTEISRDDLADSNTALDALVTDLIGQAIGWREDWEAVQGTGSGQFLGVWNAPCAINVSRNTGSTIKVADVFKMLSRALMGRPGQAWKWIAHPYALETLLALQDPSGRYLMLPSQTPNGDAPLNNATQWRLLGIPVAFSEKAAAVGSTGDLTLTDAKSFLLGRKGGLEIGLSEHFKFDTDQVALRAKVRNDGQPLLKKAVTLADGSSTVSTVVVLN